MKYNDGFIHGSGRFENVELGWFPTWVRVFNTTDGDVLYEGPLSEVHAFTSGSKLPHPGDSVTRSGVTASIRQVILDSGLFEDNTAAGWLILEPGSRSGGAFTAGSAAIRDGSANDITLVVREIMAVTITGAVATAASNAFVTAYAGVSGSASRGFQIGSVQSENAKLLFYQAFAPDSAEGPIDQVSTVW